MIRRVCLPVYGFGDFVPRSSTSDKTGLMLHYYEFAPSASFSRNRRRRSEFDLVRGRLLDMANHQNFDRTFLRFELQAKLLLNGERQQWSGRHIR